MRILIVNGAHRRSGFTSELSDLFAAGCTEAGAFVDRVDLLDHHIEHCLGCYCCYSGKHPGRCVQKDDMEDLIERFYLADGMVLATPVYFYSFSTRLKQFVERLFPVTQPVPEAVPTDGLVHHAARYPKRGPKIASLIAVMAHRNTDGVAGMEKTFVNIAFGLGARPVGTIVRPESPFMDFEASKPKTLRRIRSAFRNAGRAFVEEGMIPEKWREQATLSLTEDTDRFYGHFRTYWRILQETGTIGGDRMAVKSATSEDIRILMPEMADSYDPTAIPDLKAIVLFDLGGESLRDWHLIIEDGKCEAYAGSVGNPDVTIQASSQTIVDMILLRLDFRRALAKREIVVLGNRQLFSRFGQLFPPRSV